MKTACDNIFFDRFCFDVISLLGFNSIKITVDDLEFIIRTVFTNLTHNF
jgi:hypothetical protein